MQNKDIDAEILQQQSDLIESVNLSKKNVTKHILDQQNQQFFTDFDPADFKRMEQLTLQTLRLHELKKELKGVESETLHKISDLETEAARAAGVLQRSKHKKQDLEEILGFRNLPPDRLIAKQVITFSAQKQVEDDNKVLMAEVFDLLQKIEDAQNERIKEILKPDSTQIFLNDILNEIDAQKQDINLLQKKQLLQVLITLLKDETTKIIQENQDVLAWKADIDNLNWKKYK